MGPEMWGQDRGWGHFSPQVAIPLPLWLFILDSQLLWHFRKAQEISKAGSWACLGRSQACDLGVCIVPHFLLLALFPRSAVHLP